MTWENIYNRVKAQVIKLIGKGEVRDGELDLNALLLDAFKAELIAEGVIFRKEVGRDTFRNIPGRNVLFNNTSKTKITAIK